jgi:dTDP-4-dehydrorhamnose 3,5-epimerase
MIFVETELRGAFILELEALGDERGYFARTFCREDFARRGLNPTVAQCSTSFNAKMNTLRGMHYQAAPKAEAKLVRCTRGALYDVIIDVRSDSPTYCQWIAVELTADNGRMIYIPEGFAHGYQTLEDRTEVSYQISEFYHPEYARGIRWNDPLIGIKWPGGERTISLRDQQFADLRP